MKARLTEPLPRAQTNSVQRRGMEKSVFCDNGGCEESLRQVITPSVLQLESNRVGHKVIQIRWGLLGRGEAIQLILFHPLQELAKSGDLVRYLPSEERFSFQARPPRQIDYQKQSQRERKGKRDSRGQNLQKVRDCSTETGNCRCSRKQLQPAHSREDRRFPRQSER